MIFVLKQIVVLISTHFTNYKQQWKKKQCNFVYLQEKLAGCYEDEYTYCKTIILVIEFLHILRQLFTYVCTRHCSEDLMYKSSLHDVAGNVGI